MIKQLYKNLNIDIKEFLRLHVKCTFFAIIATGSSLFFPWFLSQIINILSEQENTHELIFYINCMVVSGLLSIVFQYLQTISLYKYAQNILLQVKRKVFSKLFKTNLKFWMKGNVGDIIAVFQHDIPMIENLLTTFLRQVFVSVIVLIGLVIFVLNIDFTLGMLTILLSLLFVLLQKKTGKQIQISMKQLRTNMGELDSFTNETINNIVDIQSQGHENIYVNKYVTKNLLYISEVLKQEKLRLGSQSISSLNNTLNICLALSLGTVKVLNGSLNIGELFSLSIYVQRLYNPIVNIINAYITIQKTIPIISKIMDIINTYDVIPYGNYIEKKEDYNIQIKNVFFTYDKKNVLNNFNLTVKKGEIIGIIGENGSGKSTLCRLLLRLCDCTSGQILVNNHNIEEYDLMFLRSLIGYLPQKCYVGSGNITEILDPFGNNYNNIQMKEVMKRVGLEDYYNEHLDKKIAENKNQISGGEAQKILLARLMLEDKPIVILDEPTSAIDIESEKNICNFLKYYLENKTAIIITHRTEILNICSRVIDIK